MTDYAGEVVPIRHTATLKNAAKTPLRPEMVASVSVEIRERGVGGVPGAVLVPETDMVWVEAEGWWEYQWDTSGMAKGSYMGQVWVTDLLGRRAWEFKTIRLSRNRV